MVLSKTRPAPALPDRLRVMQRPTTTRRGSHGAIGIFESRVAPRVETVTMVFVAIRLAFLVFGITASASFLHSQKCGLPFSVRALVHSLRLSFVRVVFFLRSKVRRRNGESGRRCLADKAHAQSTDQSRQQNQRENRHFHDLLAPGTVHRAFGNKTSR